MSALAPDIVDFLRGAHIASSQQFAPMAAPTSRPCGMSTMATSSS